MQKESIAQLDKKAKKEESSYPKKCAFCETVINYPINYWKVCRKCYLSHDLGKG